MHSNTLPSSNPLRQVETPQCKWSQDFQQAAAAKRQCSSHARLANPIDRDAYRDLIRFAFDGIQRERAFPMAAFAIVEPHVRHQ